MGMKVPSLYLADWPALLSRLPAGFDLEATARAHGAFSRAREVASAEVLLRLALAYGGCGMSLRETCAWAEVSGIARLSDPSLLERLVRSADWLGVVLSAVLAKGAEAPSRRWAGHRLRVLDGTTICRPGADRTTWRLHVGYDLAAGRIDHIELTDGSGAERLQRLPYVAGDIVLADRYYARPRDLRPVIEAGAHFIVRTGWQSLRLLRPDGAPFDLFAALDALRGQENEVPVGLDEGTAPESPLPLRLVIRRKTAAQAEAERKRLRAEATKRGRKPDPRSLRAAEYILLLTALPADTFPTADVLALYRFRWQIELAFKRMKSLAGLDELPAKKPALARTWVYARLIAILLAEDIAREVPDSSPSGPRNSRQDVDMAHHEGRPRHRSRRHPTRTPARADPQSPPPSAPALS